MATSPLPVVALDVDGVLNARGLPDEPGPGWARHRIEIPVDELPKSPYITGWGEIPLHLTVAINADLHGRWIAGLAGRAEAVWATTWEVGANTYLAPLLGIDALPIGVSVETDPPLVADGEATGTSEWKATALERRYAGRPLVWIDDENAAFAQSWPGRSGQPTLVVTADPWIGVTAEQLAEVDAFVDAQNSAQIDALHSGGPDA